MTKRDLQEFLVYFPEIELPVTLTEAVVPEFSKNNPPIPQRMIDDIFSQWEGPIDEYVEFVPCMRIEGQEHFTGIIYWRGDLLRYEYVLVTFDKEGNYITHKSIATTIADGTTIKKSVAHIDEDFIIHIMAGQNESDLDYDPQKSQAFNMEILPTGEIEFYLGDNQII